MDIVVDGMVYQYQSKGGISRIFKEVLPRMCEIDDSLNIFLFTPKGLLQDLPSHRNITNFSSATIENFLFPWFFWRKVSPIISNLVNRSKVRNTNSKIWHSTYYTLPFRWAGPTVFTIYDLVPEKFGELVEGSKGMIEQKKKALRNADLIICISETTRKDLEEHYGIPKERTCVIYCGFNDNVFKELVDHPKEFSISSQFILFVGRRASYKGIHELLLAYSKWKLRNEFQLVLVGSPITAHEAKTLKELEISENVIFLGEVSDEKLSLLYNEAAGFIYPSFYEGFGIPLLEAAACGCPIVASRIPSTEEIVGDLPFYFQPGSVEDLLIALDQVVQLGYAPERIAKGIKIAQRFSWDKTAQETLQVYKSLL